MKLKFIPPPPDRKAEIKKLKEEWFEERKALKERAPLGVDVSSKTSSEQNNTHPRQEQGKTYFPENQTHLLKTAEFWLGVVAGAAVMALICVLLNW
jgi:hypothetical protein